MALVVALWILPLGFLVGLTFGAFGLVMNSLAPSYDFFTYFFTLVLTPGLLLSGVFFPVAQMPGAAADDREPAAAQACDRHLPAAVDGRSPAGPSRCTSPVLLAYACSAYYVALVLTRRRLLR
jgi:lipooligosaccharide transport system permease protein